MLIYKLFSVNNAQFYLKYIVFDLFSLALSELTLYHIYFYSQSLHHYSFHILLEKDIHARYVLCVSRVNASNFPPSSSTNLDSLALGLAVLC